MKVTTVTMFAIDAGFSNQELSQALKIDENKISDYTCSLDKVEIPKKDKEKMTDFIKIVQILKDNLKTQEDVLAFFNNPSSLLNQRTPKEAMLASSTCIVDQILTMAIMMFGRFYDKINVIDEILKQAKTV